MFELPIMELPNRGLDSDKLNTEIARINNSIQLSKFLAKSFRLKEKHKRMLETLHPDYLKNPSYLRFVAKTLLIAADCKFPKLDHFLENMFEANLAKTRSEEQAYKLTFDPLTILNIGIYLANHCLNVRQSKIEHINQNQHLFQGKGGEDALVQIAEGVVKGHKGKLDLGRVDNRGIPEYVGLPERDGLVDYKPDEEYIAALASLRNKSGQFFEMDTSVFEEEVLSKLNPILSNVKEWEYGEPLIDLNEVFLKAE